MSSYVQTTSTTSRMEMDEGLFKSPTVSPRSTSKIYSDASASNKSEAKWITLAKKIGTNSPPYSPNSHSQPRSLENIKFSTSSKSTNSKYSSRMSSSVDTIETMAAMAGKNTFTTRHTSFQQLHVLPSSEADNTTRLKSLFNRAYYVENQKLLRGESYSHPLLQRSRNISEDYISDQPSKTWETYFYSYLQNQKKQQELEEQEEVQFRALIVNVPIVKSPTAAKSLLTSSLTTTTTAEASANKTTEAMVNGQVKIGSVEDRFNLSSLYDIEVPATSLKTDDSSSSSSSSTVMVTPEVQNEQYRINSSSSSSSSSSDGGSSSRSSSNSCGSSGTKPVKGIFSRVTDFLRSKSTNPPEIKSRPPSTARVSSFVSTDHSMDEITSTNLDVNPTPIVTAASAEASVPSQSSKPKPIGKDKGIDVSLRMSFTDFHNNSRLGFDNASAFLGEEASSFMRASSFLHNSMLAGSAGMGTGMGTSHQVIGLARGFSLEGLSDAISGAPCMIAMPTSAATSRDEAKDNAYVSALSLSASTSSSSSSSHSMSVDRFALLEALPLHAWIMPYIVSCLPSHMMSMLLSLPSLITGRPTSEEIKLRLNNRNQTFIDNHTNCSSNGKSSSNNNNNYDNNNSSNKSGSNGTSSLPKGALMGKSWRSLGHLWLNKDPSWRHWECRVVYICDNYLFELLPDGSQIVGFCQLNGATIRSSPCYIPVERGETAKQREIYSSSIVASPMSSSPPPPLSSSVSTSSPSSSTALCITSLRQSKENSAKSTFWLHGFCHDDMHIIEREIRRASSLTAEDLYEFAEGVDEEVVLGRGRFNEVRMGRRRIVKTHTRPATTTATTKNDDCSTNVDDNDGKYSAVRIENDVVIDMEQGDTDISILRESMGYDDHNSMEFFVAEDSSPRISPSTSPSACSLKSCSDDINEINGDGECGEFCALKLISKDVFWKRAASGKERADALAREFLSQTLVCQAAVRQQQHRPSSTNTNSSIPIVEIYGAFETLDGFALELELMSSMDLFDKLCRGGIFTENMTKQVVRQLVEAIRLCNVVGIAHRDIKLSNITLPRPYNTHSSSMNSDDDDEVITVKLADFGMAGFQGRDGKLRGRCGTPGYVAPDILNAAALEGYNINVDMFSIGVVVYTLLCGYEPFFGEDDKELIKSNKAVEYEFHDPEWSHISLEAQHWIRRCLDPRAEQRMTPSDALEHPWISGKQF